MNQNNAKEHLISFLSKLPELNEKTVQKLTELIRIGYKLKLLPQVYYVTLF